MYDTTPEDRALDPNLPTRTDRRSDAALRGGPGLLGLLAVLAGCGYEPASDLPAVARHQSTLEAQTDPSTEPRRPESGGPGTDSTWTITLSAAPSSPWVTQSTTLVATANADVGPTPYSIVIRDANLVVLKSCSTGTTCSHAVTYPRGSHHFYASIEAGSDPSQASAGLSVEWHSTTLDLSASQNSLSVGSGSLLTATTGQDIGPSPFYTMIFDTTTGNLLTYCGQGTSCTVTVTQTSATTHVYKAFLAPYSTTYPPPGAQEATPATYVTWTHSGWSISLSAPATTGGSVTVTANASIDVYQTPYYIQIYDLKGARIATCGAGSTCSAVFTPDVYPGSHLVAFIGSWSPALPPANIQASSGTITTERIPQPL